MRGWTSIDQDQSKFMIDSFSSPAGVFCLTINSSLVDRPIAKNSAPGDERHTSYLHAATTEMKIDTAIYTLPSMLDFVGYH